MKKYFRFAVLVVMLLPTASTMAKKYSVTYDLNFSGSPGVTTVTINKGKKLIEPKSPKRIDYEFLGWFREKQGIREWDFANDVVNSDMTLYAKWEKTNFTVIYDSDLGSRVASQTITRGDKATKPTAPTRAGYRFDGWYKDYGTFSYVWNFERDVVTADVTLYAKWTQLQRFTVSFNINGGSANPASQTIYEGDKLAKPTVPTKTGYIFEGWYKDNETFSNVWNFESDIVASAATLYAKWTQLQRFTVSFNTNGGSANPASQTIYEGDKPTEPSAPKRSDWAFVGWFKEATGITAWDFSKDVVNSNTTLYAKWTKTVYTVTFNSDGGGAVTPQIIAEGGKAIKPTPDPAKVKAGLYIGTPKDVQYIFEGWYNGATRWNFASDVVIGNITLTAKWTGGGNPISSVAENNLAAAFAYVNAYAGTYTLLISRDVSVSTGQTLNLASRHLTIIGIGGERKITYAGQSDPLFTLTNANTSLTIGENITVSNSYQYLYANSFVEVQAGSLIMKTGSKISGLKGQPMSVKVSGANSRFIMEGGEISGNSSSSQFTGGVGIYDKATFVMSGGKITGNTTEGSFSRKSKADVWIGCDAGTFTLSGNAEIGDIMLNRYNSNPVGQPVYQSSSVTIGAGGFTGIVSTLNLVFQTPVSVNISQTVSAWTSYDTAAPVPVVIKGITDVSVLNRFTLGKFIAILGDSQDIVPAYKLVLRGTEGKLQAATP